MASEMLRKPGSNDSAKRSTLTSSPGGPRWLLATFNLPRAGNPLANGPLVSVPPGQPEEGDIVRRGSGETEEAAKIELESLTGLPGET